MNRIEKFLVERGFIYPSYSIYGGMENAWDYGHLGVLLKENLKNAWVNFFVNSEENAFLYDGGILSCRGCWEATGHLQHFEKTLVECKECNSRLESDSPLPNCPKCHSTNLAEPKRFNLIFKTDNYYLRPETAQTIFVNTKLIVLNSKLRLPFKLAQIGKAFRNEVSPSRSIFRTKEFEQLELEEYIYPWATESTLIRQRENITNFLTEKLNFSPTSFEFREVTGNELPHYSQKNLDLYYKFEFGWEELWGIANRADFDLLSHQRYSSEKLHLQNEDNTSTVIPHVVEHSLGLNRLLLAVITEALRVDERRGWEILSLPPHLSPLKFAILPLTKHQEGEGKKLYKYLQSFSLPVTFVERGSIGKRYREQDGSGTYYCLTVDGQSGFFECSSFSFTLRERDSGAQKRLTLPELDEYILSFFPLKNLIGKRAK